MTDSKSKKLRVAIWALGIVVCGCAPGRVKTVDQPQPRYTDFQMGIIGDSLATGAVANPELELEAIGLLFRAAESATGANPQRQEPKYEAYPNPGRFGISNPVERLTRVFFTRDQDRSGELGFKDDQESRASALVDMEEYSFGYMVGRALGFRAADILMAAQDGRRVNSITEQADRLVSASQTRTLPRLVIISYTGNDLCDEDILEDSVDKSVETYQKTLTEQMQRLWRYRPHPQGTDVVLLAPVDVLNILTNPRVQQRPVTYNHREVSCGDLRQGEVELIGRVNRMCPAVLGTDPEDRERIARIRRVLDGFMTSQKRLVENFGDRPAQGFRLQYIDDVHRLNIDGRDIANDCFHPSIHGQTKVAEVVLDRIRFRK